MFPGPALPVGVELDLKAGISTVPHNLPNQPGVTVEELWLTLRVKEVEVRHLGVGGGSYALWGIKAQELAQEVASPASASSPSTHDSFDVSRHIALVPPFTESEIDTYLNLFECITPPKKSFLIEPSFPYTVLLLLSCIQPS